MGPLRSSPHSFVTDYNLHSSAQYKVSLSVSYRDSSAGVSRVATAGRGRARAGGAGPGSDSGPAPTTDRTRAPWRARSGHALRSRYIFTCTIYQARYKVYHLPYQCRAAAYLVVTHLNPKRCNPQHRNTLLIG